MTDHPVPPVAAKHPVRIEQLGRVRTDDYAWMKDENWRAVLHDPKALRPDIREHLDAENAYTKAMLASTEPLQAQMFEEMKGRIKQDDASVPEPDGPWDYYVRFEVGAQHPIHARRPRGRDDGEEVLLDAEAMSKGKAFFQVAAAEHSPDHRLYAYAVDEQGSEVHRIYVKDLATGETLPGPAEDGTATSPGRRIRRGCSGSGATRRAGRPRCSAGPRAAARTCWSMTSRTTASSSACTGPRPAPMS